MHNGVPPEQQGMAAGSDHILLATTCAAAPSPPCPRATHHVSRQLLPEVCWAGCTCGWRPHPVRWQAADVASA
jgi:hypothetical protein